MLRLALVFVSFILAGTAFASDKVLVFAAASQRDVMVEIGSAFEQTCDCKVVFSYASTATLARQINSGAKADIFLSANEAWVEWLIAKGQLKPENKAVFAGNTLVIASMSSDVEGLELLSAGRFAMADPVSVPAGIYAKQALENLDEWKGVKENAVYTENVRLALSSVRRGALNAGIVYHSDAILIPELKIQYVFPQTVHDPVRYVAAKLSENKKADEFLAFLLSPQAQALFQKFGFSEISATN